MSVSGRVATACGLAVALSCPAAAASAERASSGPARPASGSTASEPVTARALVPRAALIRRERARTTSTQAALRLPGSERLIVKDVIRDADGATHVRYDRTYRGVPVVGGDLVVHRSPADAIRSVTWGSHADLASLGSVRPDLPHAAAIRTARASTGLVRLAARPALVVWALGGTPRLAWKAVMSGSHGGAPARDAVVVNAQTGSRIAHWSELQTTDAVGTGTSLYSGDVQIHTDDTGGSGAGRYELRDRTRGGHYVVDMNDQDKGAGNLFTDANDIWGDAGPTDRARAAVDAQYGAATTWDFYLNTFGRNGIKNNGAGTFSRVHYDNVSQDSIPGYDNAFWSDDCFCMTYGDGTEFKPLVSLDVAGHEMSHGVTSNTAGLLYFGESGGINEATSDIFGTGVEFSAANPADSGDYYIGEKIVPSPPGFLRRMDNPKADAPLYTQGRHSFNCNAPRIGRADVHFSSGVPNHFFYLLAEGSGSKSIGGLHHTSTTCNGTTIRGIGRGKALQIWYRALTVYMTEGTNFQEARDATIRAARDLYGAKSTTCATVAKTWTGLTVKPSLWACRGSLTKAMGNFVRNGNFESRKAHWASTRGVIVREQAGFPLAWSGRRLAILNWSGSKTGLTTKGTDSLSQTLTLPRARKVTLVYHLLVDSAEPNTAARDRLKVQARQGLRGSFRTLSTFDNRRWDDSYHRMTVNLSKLRGTRVTLRFLGSENATNTTGFFIDGVSVTAG